MTAGPPSVSSGGGSGAVVTAEEVGSTPRIRRLVADGCGATGPGRPGEREHTIDANRTSVPSAAAWAVASAAFASATIAALAGARPGCTIAFAALALAAASVVRAVLRQRPAAGSAWLLLLAGHALWFVSGTSWTGTATWSVAAASHLAGLVGFACSAAGLVVLARSLTRVWDRTRWIDATVVAASVGLTAIALLMDGNLARSAGWTDRWLLPSYPPLDLFLLLLVMRSMLAVRRRSASLTLLAAACGAQLITDVLVHWVGPAGATAPDLVLVTGAVASSTLLALAAWHPSVAAAPEQALPWRRLGPVRLAVLVAALAAPALALVALATSERAPASVVVVLAVGCLALGILVLLRVSGLVTYADALADERHRGRFEALAVHSHDAVAILALDGTITWASPAVRSVIGPRADEVVGRTLDALLGPTTAAHLAPSLDRLASLRSGSTMEVRTTIVDGEGVDRDLEGVATNLLAEPAVDGIVLVVRDVTERAAMQRQLVEQAFVDPLTGLANRALFSDRVEHALTRPRTSDGDGVAVLFVDLDDFKAVNDSLGHGRGDELLEAVGRRIADAIGPSDTAARLGGDEFGVLIEDTGVADAVATADRILDLLAVPVLVGDLPLGISASIGVALAEGPSATAATLLRNADLAMYEAKRDAKGQCRTFRAEMHERELRLFHLRSDLQQALGRRQLHLVYQPIVDMETGRVTGAEALLRWIHPEHGPVRPVDFIPLAESTRAIIPIGQWVLRTACEQLASFDPELGPLTMDVNVSAVQLVDRSFVDDVADVLRDTGVAPDRLVLELTESILVSDEGAARRVLEDLRGLGIRLAIDDFGTGYSSLAYLQNFPIDIVKIDRAFVTQLGQAGRGRSLARSIIAIADSLGIETIAEGIETSEQAADLSALACAHGQGFHFSRPVDAEAFARFARGVDASAGMLTR